jgi:hypothetical protein
LILIATWIFQAPLHHAIASQAALSSDAPVPLVLSELIVRAADPRAGWLDAWNSGKIVHGQVCMNLFSRVWPKGELLSTEVDTALLAAALDPDFSVRELALGFVKERSHPELAGAAIAQLSDADPQVRSMGLRLLRAISPPTNMSAVIPLLDDPDAYVATLCLKLLESWAGRDFGVKLKDTVILHGPQAGTADSSENARLKLKEGVARAKTWWAEHQSQLGSTQLRLPSALYPPLGRLRLRDLSCPPWRAQSPAQGFSGQGCAAELLDYLVRGMHRRNAAAGGDPQAAWR